MKHFKIMFGTGPAEIKPDCLLLPIVNKTVLAALNIKRFKNGLLYATANRESYTVVRTRMGAAFTGDAVLYLSHAGCRRLVLFGSCGLVRKRPQLDLGSLVAVERCLAWESFSDMLHGRNFNTEACLADKKFLEYFTAATGGAARPVTCCTVGSVHLEEAHAGLFAKNKIDVVDMECSAFYAAAAYSGISALAVLIASDIVKTKPFYRQWTVKEKQTYEKALAAGLRQIDTFFNKTVKKV